MKQNSVIFIIAFFVGWFGCGFLIDRPLDFQMAQRQVFKDLQPLYKDINFESVTNQNSFDRNLKRLEIHLRESH